MGCACGGRRKQAITSANVNTTNTEEAQERQPLTQQRVPSSTERLAARRAAATQRVQSTRPTQ